MPKSIFISYRRNPHSQMHILVKDRLEKLNYDVFLDLTSIPPSVEFAKMIDQKIRECNCFVVLLASNTVDSEWVQREIRTALDHRRFIIPITIESGVSYDTFPTSIKELANFNGLAVPPDQHFMEDFFEHLVSAIERQHLMPRPVFHRERLEGLLHKKYEVQRTRFSVVPSEGSERTEFYRRTAEVFQEEINNMLPLKRYNSHITVGLVCGSTLREIVQHWWANRPILNKDDHARLKFVSLNRAGFPDRYQFTGNYLAVSLSEIFRGASHQVNSPIPVKTTSPLPTDNTVQIDVLFCSAGGRGDGFLHDWVNPPNTRLPEKNIFPDAVIGDFCLWPIDVDGNVVLDPPELRTVIEELHPQPRFQKLSEVKKLCQRVIFPITSQRRSDSTSIDDQTNKDTITRVILESGVVSHCILDEELAENLLWNTNSELCGYRLLRVLDEKATEITYHAISKEAHIPTSVRLFRSSQQILRHGDSHLKKGQDVKVREIIISDPHAAAEIEYLDSDNTDPISLRSLPIYIGEETQEILLEPGVRKPGYWSIMTIRTVEKAIEEMGDSRPLRIWDMGCGSGVVGLILGRNKKVNHVLFSDIDPNATACTERNLKKLAPTDFTYDIRNGDLFEAARGEKYDLIVFTPPFYPDFIRTENPIADTGGPNGTELSCKFADQVADYLTSNGRCVLYLADYVGYNETRERLRHAGLIVERIRRDILYPFEPRKNFPQSNEIKWRKELEEFYKYQFREENFDNRHFLSFRMVHLIGQKR